jgi:hypothetical protein
MLASNCRRSRGIGRWRVVRGSPRGAEAIDSEGTMVIMIDAPIVPARTGHPASTGMVVCLVTSARLVLGCGANDGKADAESGTSTTSNASEAEASAGPPGDSTAAAATTADPSASTGDGAGPGDPADFEARCAAEGVLVCVGFDEDSELAGTFGDVRGILVGDVTPELDSSTKASGASSLKFTIPTNSGPGASGSYFANFSEDLTVQFDGEARFFVQWRQRFSLDFIMTDYEGGGGWKQAIIGVGDQPGCSPDNAVSIAGGGNCATSCTELETVVQNTRQRRFPQMYNSCSGSTSHGPYDPFEEPFRDFDFKLQNARPDPYCLYTQDLETYFPPTGNCFGYAADEWMTFQVEIATGPREGDEFKDSEVRLWVAREGQPSELVVDWGPYDLTAGDPASNLRFGKVWLLPYHTDKSDTQAHPTAHTWYDELIVSSERIADPLE